MQSRLTGHFAGPLRALRLVQSAHYSQPGNDRPYRFSNDALSVALGFVLCSQNESFLSHLRRPPATILAPGACDQRSLGTVVLPGEIVIPSTRHQEGAGLGARIGHQDAKGIPAVDPPSTAMVVPVMKDAWSEHRKAIV